MILDFSELNNHFFTVSDIFLKRQISDGKTKFVMQKPRPTDAFLLFANTHGVCYQEGEEPLYIPHGALVYMPKNSRYIWENSPLPNSNVQENLLFEFTLKNADVKVENNNKKTVVYNKIESDFVSFSNKVTIVSINHFSVYKKLMDELIELFESKDFSPLGLYNKIYEFFYAVSNNCKIDMKNNLDISIIKNSIFHLEECSLPLKSIKEIAKECNISVSYYERLFRSCFGVTPTEYRNVHRINQIKVFLQKTDMTLEEIAEKNGYCDSGYLCRFFRKETGMTPKEYRKLYIMETQKNYDKKGEQNEK